MIPYRLATYYGASFLMIGIHLPFWPVWLESKGLGAEEIGMVIALGIVMKIIANPLVAQVADRRGERKRLIVLLTTISLAIFALFALASGFWSIVIINCIFFAFWSPAMPLQESLTMQSAARYGFDYGRIRLWGSITFIISAMGIGHLLKGSSTDLIYWTIAGTIALTSLSALLLPDIRPPTSTLKQLPFITVLKDRRFVLFLLASALVNASHAVLYGFGTIHWQRAGLSSDVIGGLWAEGVIVEIALFIFGQQVVTKIGPARLIALAGVAGVIRWTGIGLTTDLPFLIVLQALHGLTFGAAHLGAMHFIQSRIKPELSATAQSLYSSVVMGIGMGTAFFFSGYLFAAYGASAYFPMALMSGLGAVIIFMLRRRKDAAQ